MKVRVALIAGLFLFAAALSSCARPKYEVVTAPSPQQTPAKPGDPAAAPACEIQFSVSGLCVEWQWEQSPTASQPGSLQFRIYQLANDGTETAPDLSLLPAVVLWMPSMGHGSTPVAVEKVTGSEYRGSNVFFIMPGAWEIKFQFKNGDVVEDEAVVALTI